MVDCDECGMRGPRRDFHGAAWDYLPRREDLRKEADTLRALAEAGVAAELRRLRAYERAWKRLVHGAPQEYADMMQVAECILDEELAREET